MVLNTFGLRINICHPYIILLGILIGTLYFRSTKADCLRNDSVSVLDVCSSSARTNKIVHLYVDSQRLPPNFEGECSCDVAISENWRSIHILYSSSVGASCGIEFNVLTYTYECTDVISSIMIPFNRTTFRKTSTIDGSACLSISLDHNFPKTNASVAVTCYAVNARTSTVSILSTLNPVTTTISSTTHFSTGKHQSTNAAQTTNSPTSSKETSMFTDGFTRKVSPPTGEDESSDSAQIGIIVGTVVGGSAVLVVAIILIVCCYRKRQQKANSNFDFANKTSDHEVTDNVVYNMEFPEDMERPQIPLNDMDTTYNTIDNKAYHQGKETSSPVPYANLQLDGDGGTYNTVNLDENHQAEKTPNPATYNSLHFSDDAGAYNTVDCDKNPNKQTATGNDSPLRPEIDTDPSYDTLERGQDTDIIDKTNSTAADQNQTLNIAYAVVNKTKSSDKTNDSNRPNQFQVAESGDTYALVNKNNAQ